MYEKFGWAMREKAIAMGLAEAQDIEGCTEEEITILREKQKVSFLPEVYRQFLLYLGKKGGRIYADVDAFYDYLVSMKEIAIEIVEFRKHRGFDKSSWVLPEDAFVFYMYIGQQFFFFHTLLLDDNPMVYTYPADSDDEEIEVEAICLLSKFLLVFIKDTEGEAAVKEFLSKYAK